MQWFYLDANQQQVPVDQADLGTLLQNGTIGAETLLWNETMTDWQPGRELFPDWFPEASGVVEEAQAARTPVLVTPKRPAMGVVKRPIQTSAGGAITQKTSGSRTQRTSGRAGARGKAAAEEIEESEESVDLVKSLASVLVARSGWIKFVGVMTIIAGVFLCLSIVGALVGWIPIWMGTVLFRATGALEQAAFFGRRSDLEEVLFRVGSFFKLNGVFILAYMAFVIMIYGLIFVLGFASMIAHPELIQPELTPSVGPE